MNNNSLEHYGVLGMKWGVRRYQNKDGRLTSSGKNRYASQGSRQKKALRGGFGQKKRSNFKRNAAVGAVAVAGVLAAYGGYRYAKAAKNKNVQSTIKKGLKAAEAVVNTSKSSSKTKKKVSSTAKRVTSTASKVAKTKRKATTDSGWADLQRRNQNMLNDSLRDLEDYLRRSR